MSINRNERNAVIIVAILLLLLGIGFAVLASYH